MAERSEPVLDIPAEDIALGSGAELEYAGFWSRVAALIVDNAVVTIFGVALLIGAASVGEGAVLLATFAYFLIALLYWPVMESSERQATFGKQLLGLQVTDQYGARLSFVRSLLRNLAKIISSLPFGLGFLLAAFTARKQALHDTITKCLVVRSGPSNFMKAVISTVGALVISIAGGYYYFTEVYLPQMTQDMDQAMKQAQKGAPAKPATAPAAQPAPAATPPGGPKPMTPQEIAEFEKKMAQAKPEPAKVAAATPPASPATAKPEEKPAVPAPAKPSVAEAKPAPAKPEPAPAAKETAPKPAAKPKPAPAVEAPAATAPEAPAPTPAPAAEQPAAPRVRAEPSVLAYAPLTGRVRTPRFNDVMTAVMYRDTAAAAELIELGFWVDRRDSNGVTPLMAAAWNGDVAMTQLLLKAGADPNGHSPGGSVLAYAGRGGDAIIIQMLRSGGAR